MITTKDRLNRKNQNLGAKAPIRVVQFGEGNFLRAFVDYAIQVLNQEVDFDAGVAVVQPIEKGMVEMINQQDGLYTLFLRGIENGKNIDSKQVISNIVKTVNPYADFQQFKKLAHEEQLEFIISNTTEAGIAFNSNDSLSDEPASSFPGKLTQLLYERFQYFKGDVNKGLIIIPCELINYNGDELRKILFQYADIWSLGADFTSWVEASCSFHNTLVDRIVPGYPREDIEAYETRLDYQDQLIVVAEPFFFWVIEGDEKLQTKLPFHKTSLDVRIVKDMQSFRTRKVRILNGIHTAMTALSIFHGLETVAESIENEFVGSFVEEMVQKEIIPILDMDQSELEEYTRAVYDRFRNPYIVHELESLALNAIAKFKVRDLTSLLEYVNKKGQLPRHLTFSFACLLAFYRGEYRSRQMPIHDDDQIVTFFAKAYQDKSMNEYIHTVLCNQALWDQDLTKIAGLEQAISHALELIEKHPIDEAFQNFEI